ncbi:hypothetical protein [Stygiolobus caldivivus]|uniref:Uncharacterized protein n=1 Tax=Stygiolobus caldivivus TaxID=2824673 RepID=A0A8D5U5J0_9CREN|nr:hypothetical protein [Stygiolobus caldivivus]BCU69694.1 hypothetical protein KN1_09910 [Stygiolobus caldivivus]
MSLRNRIMLLTGTVLASVSPYFTPLVVPGVVLVALSRKAFSPNFKDSIYTPSFQRFTAWFLLVLATLEGVTGFGAGPQTSTVISALTFGLLNRGNSLQLHIILIGPLTFFFILHSASGIGSMLLRRGVRNWVIYEVVIPILTIGAYILALYLYTLLL